MLSLTTRTFILMKSTVIDQWMYTYISQPFFVAIISLSRILLYMRGLEVECIKLAIKLFISPSFFFAAAAFFCLNVRLSLNKYFFCFFLIKMAQGSFHIRDKVIPLPENPKILASNKVTFPREYPSIPPGYRGMSVGTTSFLSKRCF